MSVRESATLTPSGRTLATLLKNRSLAFVVESEIARPVHRGYEGDSRLLSFEAGNAQAGEEKNRPEWLTAAFGLHVTSSPPNQDSVVVLVLRNPGYLASSLA